MTDETTKASETAPEITTGEPKAERRNFYGRVHGKTLRASQKDYLANDLELIRLKRVTAEENPAREVLDPAKIFPSDQPLWLEIGFGGGEHLAHMAERYPGINIIGAEPFVNGVAMLLGKVRQLGLSNLVIHPGDVRDLFDVLPDQSVEKAFLNYPDPWPKARHHRRRFVTPGYLALLARVMKPGAEFRVATDIPDYVRQTLEEVPPAGFDLVKEAGLGEHWEDWISTRYEQKALREDRLPHYLTFIRKG